MAVFVNEIHYDNTGTDVGEAVEIAGAAGTDLTGYKLVLYNGENASAALAYFTLNLTGTIDDEGNGFGALSFAFPTNGIQNGARDGFALIAPDGTVIQFISYEGVMTAATGTPAAGLTSVDIGISENGTEALGGSLHLIGTGTQYSDFTWAKTTGATFGATNTGQSFAAANPGVLSISDASVTEGNAGTTSMSFVVNRTGGAVGAVSATYTISFAAGGADATDLEVATPLTGTVNFANGEISRTISVNVAGDIVVETTESFTVTLSAPTGGATIADGVATGTITNDDAAATLAIADATVTEGNSGSTSISFIVTRGGETANPASADYGITFGGADTADFAFGSAFSGSVVFAAGETSKAITLSVAGDIEVEATETFTVTLSNPSSGVLITDGTALGTITNDDTAPIANVFINEIHYDNTGADVGEAIEVAGVAGTNLAGWTLVLYNGSNGASYGTLALSGVIGDQSNGFGTLQFPRSGIQNGSPDGIALVDNLSRVVQFLSYEGTLVATDGPAVGLTSTDIGVSEEGPVGFSLQLVGSGGSYEDFTWTAAPISNTFGAVNTGQTFLSATDPGQIRILDASVVEGNSGTTFLTFIIRRAGGTELTSDVNYNFNLDGSANGADLGPTAQAAGSVQFARGETQKTISIEIQGDVVGEFNETLSVTLTSATNATIVDGYAVGTIINDDPIALSIYQIQGQSHLSAFEGQIVTTTGVVTAVDSNGFYLQDAIGDGNSNTSDAIFVFTSSAPLVVVGDAASVTGTVAEVRPGNNPDNLTTTQINSPVVTVLSNANPLPAATLIGAGGALPPSDVFDDDQFTIFDPNNDAADFYESLEGMRITIDAPLVTSPTNGFGETYVVASGGSGATGVNDRGGITISGNDNGFDDYNPERLQLDDDSGLFAGYTPNYTQGDRLSSVTGIVSYNFQSYEVLVTEAVTITTDVGTLQRESTLLQGTENRLSIAAYNVENLDPGDNKFDILANDIVFNLRAPDLLSLEEIQDADGAGSGSDLSGYVTAQGLIDAIKAIGGPNYVYIEVTPTTANSTGGEPGGNIRNGFLYNADRVDYVDGSAVAVPGSAFNGSRSPLAANFVFNGETITAISVHSTSRGGSESLFGANQPPANAGEAARIAQSTAIKSFIDNLLSADPNAYVAVLGDFNAFYFEQSLELIEGNVITNLYRTLPEEERYSYIFEGNAQGLDHILVSNNLATNAIFDAVHMNSDQPDTPNRASDHDGLVATLLFNSAAVAQAGTATGNEDTSIIGALIATDKNDDVLTYTIVNGPTNGAVTLGSNGTYTYTPNANYNGPDSFTFKANDGTTDSSVATVQLNVTAVNDAPVNTVPVSQTMAEDGTLVFSTANGNALSINDVDAGTTPVTVSLSATNGTLTLGGLAGLVFTTGDGTGDGTMTFTGTQAAINAALQGTSYAPNANYNGPAAVTISTNDNGATGTGGSLNDADTVAVTVTAVNDASVARDDLFATTETAIIIGNVYADNGFGADSDVDGPVEAVAKVAGLASLVGTTFTTTQGGSVQVKANGDLAYTPNASVSQLAAASSGAINTKIIDSFTYTLANGSQATVTVTINGADNADLVLGTPDNDSLRAGQDNDTLIGYRGADLLDGGAGIDTASYVFDEGAVFVNLTLGQGFGNAAQGDTYISIENVIGTDYNDFIIGDPGVNRLDGGAGNDTLIGAVGPDVLVGGTGTDTASYEDNSGTVFVNLTLNRGYNNAAEGDVYDSVENLVGGLFDDFFIGDEKDNRLDGAMGADTLLGAGGKDTFVFAFAPGAASGFVNPNSSANVDTILDFTSGQDKIELGAAAFSGLMAGTLDPNAFVLGTTALDADDRIIYDQATGSLYFDADGSGSGAATLFAMLDTKPAIVSTDFVIM